MYIVVDTVFGSRFYGKDGKPFFSIEEAKKEVVDKFPEEERKFLIIKKVEKE